MDEILTSRGMKAYRGEAPNADDSRQETNMLVPTLVWHNPVCFASFISGSGTLHVWLIRNAKASNVAELGNSIARVLWNLCHEYAYLLDMTRMEQNLKISLSTWAMKNIGNEQVAIDTAFFPMFPTRNGNNIFNQNGRAMQSMCMGIAHLLDTGEVNQVTLWSESNTGAQQFRENHEVTETPIFLLEILIRPRTNTEWAPRAAIDGRLRSSDYLGYLPVSQNIRIRTLLSRFFYNAEYAIDWQRAQAEARLQPTGSGVLPELYPTTDDVASSSASASANTSGAAAATTAAAGVAAPEGGLAMYRSLQAKIKEIEDWAIARNVAHKDRMSELLLRNIAHHRNGIARIQYNRMTSRLYNLLLGNLEQLYEIVRLGEFDNFQSSDDGIPPIIASIWISTNRIINTFLS